MNNNFIIFDFETTGFDHLNHEIIEIAAEKILESGDVVEKFHAYVVPEKGVNPEAEAVNRLSEDFLLRHGKKADEVLPAFRNFYANHVLVGHNILGFDLKFLQNSLRNLNLEIPSNPYIDTLMMARQLMPGMPDYKLTTLANFFRIQTEGAHRADKDVEMNRIIFLKLLDLYKKYGIPSN